MLRLSELVLSVSVVVEAAFGYRPSHAHRVAPNGRLQPHCGRASIVQTSRSASPIGSTWMM
jgi:hypothetical protein